jgi:hypothetical protein
MDAFGHLSVLISIILGLAITQVLQGFRGIVLARARVRMYWVPVLWAAIVLVFCVQAWWAMFGLRELRGWTFAGFAVVLLQVLAMYMQAAFVLPDFSGDHRIDLRLHFYRHLRWFFGSGVLLLVVSLTKDVVLSGHLPEAFNVGFHLVLGSLFTVAALWPHSRFQKGAVVFTAVAVLVYIVVLFARLR